MNIDRKIHSQPVLKNLPAEKQAAIVEHIDGLGGNSIVQRSQWLHGDGIKASPESVGQFHRWYLLREKFMTGAEIAQEMAAYCKEKGWVKTAQEERAAAQVFFNRIVLAEGDPKLWAMVERVNLLKDRVELEEKKLSMKAGKQKERKGKSKKSEDSAMTAEEKEAVVNQILGIS